MRWAFVVAISGIVFYLAFLVTVDVPMYLNRWRADLAEGSKLLGFFEGLREVSTCWIVTHDHAHWKDEIAWMSLYFSGAVWASLALCACYSLENYLPRYRIEATLASQAFAMDLGGQLTVSVARLVYCTTSSLTLAVPAPTMPSAWAAE